jgi:hypothetical protein
MKELNFSVSPEQSQSNVRSFISQIISTSLNRKTKEESNNSNIIKSFTDSIIRTVLTKEKKLKKPSYKSFTSEVISNTINKLKVENSSSNVKNYINEIINKTLNLNSLKLPNSETTVRKFTDGIIKKVLFESKNVIINNFNCKKFADEVISSVINKQKLEKKFSYKKFVNSIFDSTLKKAVVNDREPVKNFISSIISKTVNVYNKDMKLECCVSNFSSSSNYEFQQAEISRSALTNIPYTTKIKQFADEVITNVILKYMGKDVENRRQIRFYVTEIFNAVLYSGKIKLHLQSSIEYANSKSTCNSKKNNSNILGNSNTKVKGFSNSNNNSNNKSSQMNKSKITEINSKNSVFTNTTTTTTVINTVTTTTVKGGKKQSVIVKKEVKTEKIDNSKKVDRVDKLDKTEKIEKTERSTVDKIEKKDKTIKLDNSSNNKKDKIDIKNNANSISNNNKSSSNKKNLNGSKFESVANKLTSISTNFDINSSINNNNNLNNVEIIEENGLNKEKVVVNVKQTQSHTVKSNNNNIIASNTKITGTNTNSNTNSNKANGAKKPEVVKETFNNTTTVGNKNVNKPVTTVFSSNNSNMKSSTFNKSNNAVKSKLVNTSNNNVSNHSNKLTEQVKKPIKQNNAVSSIHTGQAISTKHNKTQSIGFFIEEKSEKLEKGIKTEKEVSNSNNNMNKSSVPKNHRNSKSMIKSPSKPESLKSSFLTSNNNNNTCKVKDVSSKFSEKVKEKNTNTGSVNEKINSSRVDKYTTLNNANSNIISFNSNTNNRKSSVPSRQVNSSSNNFNTSTNNTNTNINKLDNQSELTTKSKTKTSQFNTRTRISKSNNFDMIPENNNHPNNQVTSESANFLTIKTKNTNNSIPDKTNIKHSSSMEKIPKLTNSVDKSSNRKSSITSRIKPNNKYSVASLTDVTSINQIKEVNEQTIVSGNNNGDRKKEKRASIVDRPFTCVGEKRVDTHLDLDALKKKLGRKSVRSGRASLTDPFSLKRIYITYFSFFSVFFKPAFPLKHYFFYWKLMRSRNTNTNLN